MNFCFEHVEENAFKMIKARSERAAWKKMRRFIIQKMYGEWALFYSPDAVDAVMRKLTCTSLGLTTPPKKGG